MTGPDGRATGTTSYMDGLPGAVSTRSYVTSRITVAKGSGPKASLCNWARAPFYNYFPLTLTLVKSITGLLVGYHRLTTKATEY